MGNEIILNNNAKCAILKCIQNSKHLLEDADEILYNRPSTSLYLAYIAQEEISKAFIIYLLSKYTLEWSDARKLIKDHKSKQLLGVIIDFLEPEIDVWLEQNSLNNINNRRILPEKIAHALNTIVHEKIMGNSRNDWLEENEPIHTDIKLISDGKYDEKKQDSLYVRIIEPYTIVSEPSMITKKEAEIEIERARRLTKLFHYSRDILRGPVSLDFIYINSVIKLMLNKITLEEFILINN